MPMAESDHPRIEGIEPQLSSIDAIASALGPVSHDFGDLSSPDGAVTLMLTDIDEAPSVEQRLGPERWTALLRDHETLVRQLVSHHDGQIVKAQRDGFLASFSSAHAGLHCAIELQRTLAGDPPAPAAASDPGGPAFSVRAGLHSGFVIVNPDELLGRNVVLAARIAAQAKGGEILVSSTLKEFTERDPSFHFSERGEFHFKGVLGEHTVYAVRWDQVRAG
jgi:class 3 adenylate cyclase